MWDNNRVKVNGEVPYEDADAVLGLDAGNRLSLKFKHPSINSKADLPSGTIVTVIGDTVTNTYTKDAFEEDGSLIYVGNVSNNNVTIKITWTTGNETVYIIDLSSVELEEAGE